MGLTWRSSVLMIKSNTEIFRKNLDNELLENKPTWTEIITPKKEWFDLRLNELWDYRDLILLFVRRDFVTVYKQTILGPLWHLIQPVFTTLIFTVVFGRVANISTDGAPHFIFYLAGITIWQYFSKCLTNTSNTFVQNATIFGKVYFPRLTIPVSLIISSMLTFAIQFILFLTVYGYYFYRGEVAPNHVIFMLPLFLLIMAVLGLGLGIIFSSLTTKYRDLSFLLTFGIQLFMYATPVIYPSSILGKTGKMLMSFNPVAPIVEGFRYGFLGTGSFELHSLLYSASISVVIFLIGVGLFHKVEKTFMDTV